MVHFYQQFLLKSFQGLFLFFLALFLPSVVIADIQLKDNLKRAHSGDFIVTEQNKSYTLLHIYNISEGVLTIEEITVPANKIELKNFSWKEWVRERAPLHTSWIMYEIVLSTGEAQEYKSSSSDKKQVTPKINAFLSTLLNLKLVPISTSERKKIGPPPGSGTPDRRPFWQPCMIVDGKEILGETFQAWRTRWPKDETELSDKIIEVYLPENNSKAPSYFPYWLQINGMVGKAKIRIIDSGSHLNHP